MRTLCSATGEFATVESMTGHRSLQFLKLLREAGHLRTEGQAIGEHGAPGALRTIPGATWFRIRDFGKSRNLSAGELADEVASFYQYERATLRELLQAKPLVASFSQRFLRETLVFPYDSVDHRAVLAIADPTDLAAKRAAEIVLGPAIEIKVAAFDDLAVVLDKRLRQ